MPTESIRNRCIRFVQRPQGGPPTPAVFAEDATEIVSLAEGEFLMRNNFLSIDPALVSRMRDEDNYVESIKGNFNIILIKNNKL